MTTRQRTTRNLLRPSDASALAGVHPRTLIRWANRGILTKTLTPGGHYRYRKDEIDEWLAASQPQTQPPPRDPGLPDPALAALIDGDLTDSTCPTCGQALP